MGPLRSEQSSNSSNNAVSQQSWSPLKQTDRLQEWHHEFKRGVCGRTGLPFEYCMLMAPPLDCFTVDKYERPLHPLACLWSKDFFLTQQNLLFISAVILSIQQGLQKGCLCTENLFYPNNVNLHELSWLNVCQSSWSLCIFTNMVWFKVSFKTLNNGVMFLGVAVLDYQQRSEGVSCCVLLICLWHWWQSRIKTRKQKHVVEVLSFSFPL